MVARNTDPESRHRRPPHDVIRGFLVWWQRTLTAAFGAAVQAVERARRAPETPVRSSPRAFSLQSASLAWAGGLAVALGAAATVALSGTGQSRSVAVSAAIMTLMWAAVRWALVDMTARHRTGLTRAQVRGAWALGALVWVIGVTPELRALAWAASGIVTWLILERLGNTRRQALTCVGIAWGAQALVVVGSWLARNAIIAILAARG